MATFSWWTSYANIPPAKLLLPEEDIING